MLHNGYLITGNLIYANLSEVTMNVYQAVPHTNKSITNCHKLFYL